jgi:hypothetical protein
MFDNAFKMGYYQNKHLLILFRIEHLCQGCFALMFILKY